MYTRRHCMYIRTVHIGTYTFTATTTHTVRTYVPQRVHTLYIRMYHKEYTHCTYICTTKSTHTVHTYVPQRVHTLYICTTKSTHTVHMYHKEYTHCTYVCTPHYRHHWVTSVIIDKHDIIQYMNTKSGFRQKDTQ